MEDKRHEQPITITTKYHNHLFYRSNPCYRLYEDTIVSHPDLILKVLPDLVGREREVKPRGYEKQTGASRKGIKLADKKGASEGGKTPCNQLMCRMHEMKVTRSMIVKRSPTLLSSSSITMYCNVVHVSLNDRGVFNQVYHSPFELNSLGYN